MERSRAWHVVPDVLLTNSLERGFRKNCARPPGVSGRASAASAQAVRRAVSSHAGSTLGRRLN